MNTRGRRRRCARAGPAALGCRPPPRSPARAPSPDASRARGRWWRARRARARSRRRIGADKPIRDRVFPAQYWFALLLQGYQMTGELARPAMSCSGSPINQEGDGCPGETSPVRVNPGAIVSNRDVTIVNINDSRRLVWAVTDRYADGQGEGPVALVEIEPQGLAVRAMGVLRAYPENPSLRLARLGSGTVLVADGEYCSKPASCERATRIMPLVGDRFINKPLVDDKNACLGPAFFPMHQAGVAHGRKRAKYEISVSITYGPDNMSVREQLGSERRGARVGHRHRFVRDARAVGAAGDVEGREPGRERAVDSRPLAGAAAAAVVGRRVSQGLPSP